MFDELMILWATKILNSRENPGNLNLQNYVFFSKITLIYIKFIKNFSFYNYIIF